MRAAVLRNVLLIQAIEETDRIGELLPLAERSEATREAVREARDLRHAFAGGRLSRTAERVIALRAERLRGKLLPRAPIIDELLHPLHAPAWIAQTLFVGAILLGLLLAFLGGFGYVDILAWPLLVLILWNLVVYIRAATGATRRRSFAGALYTSLTLRHARRLIAQSGRFHAQLTDPLQRFVTEWGGVAGPLLAQQGRRLAHLGALSVAVGLVIGWCIRIFVLRDEAGWSSNFFGPRVVLWLVHALHGPAAALLGVSLPADSQQMEALRWPGINPSRDTPGWLHLMAATVGLYIVIPRIVAFLLSSARKLRLAHSLPPSRTLLPYARGVLLNVTELGAGVASVTPYAFTPDHYTVEGLENVLAAAVGSAVLLDMRAPITYGAKIEDTPGAADWTVLLCSLASTPDAQAHGALLAACRDRLLEGRGHAPLLIAIDESPMLESFGEAPGAGGKLAARRREWNEFVANYGLPACILPFGRYRRGVEVDPALRDTVRAAFWSPTVTAPPPAPAPSAT